MTDKTETLADLRQEIDELDDAAHDMFMARAELVSRAGRIKAADDGGQGSMFRPDREAVILRRLIERHQGRLPVMVVVNMWRQLISGCTWLQGPFSLQVYGGEDRLGNWDLARSHFGSAAPMSLQDNAFHVLASVKPGKSILGVLPAPDGGDALTWWADLLADIPNAPRIIAKLPIVTDPKDGAGPSAYVVGCLERGESGADMSLVAVTTDVEVSRGRLIGWFESVGLKARLLSTSDPDRERKAWAHLVEVPCYLAEDDPRVAQIIEQSNERANSVGVIGGHAVPITLPAGADNT